MSGGGGGGYGGRRAGWAPPRIDASRQETARRGREAAVENVIREALAEINQIDTEAVERHKQTLLSALKDQFDGVVDLRGGGSRTRGTYANGLSDVDVLLDLGDYASSTIASKNDPAALRQMIAERLRQRLPNTQIDVGKMAVTVRYSDRVEVQVLPAFRQGDGYRIPDPDGGWTVTRPREFVRLLNQRTQEIGGGLRRAIKLAKRICDNQGVDVKSYHLETMAVAAFEGYRGPNTMPAMLRHLFARAKELATRPMPDVTGQSVYVDSYLASSEARRVLARGLGQAERRLDAAGDDAEAWRDLLS